MNEALNELAARLLELGCRYVDRYNGQPERQNEHVHDWPAAFVEVGPINWEPLRGQRYTAVVSLSIHLVQQHLGDHFAPEANPTNPKLNFTLTDSITRGLEQWLPTHMGQLQPTQLLPARQWDQLITDRLVFQTRLSMNCS